METRFRRRVQCDLNEILGKYYDIADQLGEDFFAEFLIGLSKVVDNPPGFHFDRNGLGRCNLDRFPYHFLDDIRRDYIRIWVLRHNGRNPDFGLERFPEQR